MAREINLLHPKAAELANKLVEECSKKGLSIKITDTLRNKSEQEELYAQGRTKPGNKVTNARYPQSNHNWGIAFDFCRNDGKGAFDDKDGFFYKVGQVGKSIGLAWGGDWTSFPDRPHFEYLGFGKWSTLKFKYGTPEKFLGSNAKPGESTSSNVLKLGSRGQAVTDLQNKLNSLGYSCGAADGIFGSKTAEAVKEFQKDKGLTVDGIVGDKTRAALNSTKPSQEDTPAEGGDPLIKEYQQELNAQFKCGLVVDGVYGPKTEAAAVTIRKGAKGNLTRILQKLLSSRTNYFGGAWDGIFGKDTEATVKTYQKQKGLSVDGIVGKNTWRALLTRA